MLIGAVVLTVAAPARADYIASSGIQGGPTIAGSRLVFMEVDPDRNAAIRSTALDGSDPKTLHELDTLLKHKRPTGADPEYAFAASDKRVIAAVGWLDPNVPDIGPDASLELLFSGIASAPFGGRPTAKGCLQGADEIDMQAVAAYGNAVAWFGDRCLKGIVVRDFAAGPNPPPRVLPVRRNRWTEWIELSGPYVGAMFGSIGADNGEVVIYDRRTGRKVIDFGDKRRPVQNWDVDDAGTTTVIYGRDNDRCAYRVSVIAPGKHTRALGTKVCNPSVVSDSGKALILTRANSLNRQSVVDLGTGHEVHVTQPFAFGLENMTYRRGRVAYAREMCDGRFAIGSSTVAALRRKPLGVDVCSGQVTSDPVLAMGDADRVTVTVTCPLGCSSGRTDLTAVLPGAAPPSSGNQNHVDSPAGTPTSAVLNVPGPIANQVRAQGSLKADVVLSIHRFDGSTQVSRAPVELRP